MNQLSTSQKRFPRTHQDIAADYFALRKEHSGTRWVFSEARNALNPLSHCDIAWTGALASYAHTENKGSPGAAVVLEDGSMVTGEQLVAAANGSEADRVRAMFLTDNPNIWRPFRGRFERIGDGQSPVAGTGERVGLPALALCGGGVVGLSCANQGASASTGTVK